MKIKNILFIFALALTVIGCQDTEEKSAIFTIGDEVMFSASLDNKGKRTVYGDEDADGKAFPIFWKNGDKVQIFSPECLTGRRSAEYKINVNSDGAQNYANSMTKTGDYGVQWGEKDEANFYSLYPSGNYTLSSDGEKAENIFINYSQNIIVDGENIKSDMEDCLMYAKTSAKYEDGVVKLKYTPISTVFIVTLSVDGESNDDFMIQSVKLSAANTTTNIAGKFSINVSNGAFAEWGDNNADNILAQISDKKTGGFYTIEKGKTLQIPLFIAPVTGLNTDGWKIEVVTNKGIFTKTLTNQAVAAGKIHKISLPKLKTEKQPVDTDWDVTKWMTYIPRNVYLSEISIPGSWNSLNTDAQGTSPTISGQYTNGVRAFHFDTRWKRTGSRNNYTYELGIAIGGSGNTTSGDDKYMTAGATFAEALTEIIGNVKNDEYMVVICTFAQNSAQYNGADGWIKAISSICNDKDAIYDAKDLTANTLVGDVLGKVIVIINMEGDVTSAPTNSKCLFADIPLTLNSGLFGTELNDNNIAEIHKSEKVENNANTTKVEETGISFYNTQAQISVRSSNDIGNGNKNDGDRGYIPLKDERITVANNILEWSKKNYSTENYKHDKWIYLGLGGYYAKYSFKLLSGGYGWYEADDANTNVASDFNNWINGKVTEMGTTPSGATEVVPYYPVGIVLMNYVNSYATTVKNILTLNKKYRLQNDPNKPTDYNPNAKSKEDYDSPLEDGGDAF